MARNQEKANTMLSRMLRYKDHVKAGGPAKRRPHLAEECDNLGEANKWRGQIIREVKRGVAEIQNASLGEHKIRDLNDKINKLFREKYHWERRIRDLGGHNHIRNSKKITNDDEVLLGHNGVRYFGAARYLPGVKEFLEVKLKERAAPKRITRGELYNRINPDYFGFGDDDDGLLMPLEESAEKRLRLERINRWRQKHGMSKLDSIKQEGEAATSGSSKKRLWKSHVNIPTEDDIQKILLEQRKRLILERYMTDGPEARRLAAHDNAGLKRIELKKKKEADKENEGEPAKKRQKTTKGKSPAKKKKTPAKKEKAKAPVKKRVSPRKNKGKAKPRK